MCATGTTPPKATRNTPCATNAAIARAVAFGELTQGSRSPRRPSRGRAGEGFAECFETPNTATVTGPSASCANALPPRCKRHSIAGEGAGFLGRAPSASSMEAVTYRNLEAAAWRCSRNCWNAKLPKPALATHQLRYWHAHFKDGNARLRKAANDKDPIVRMEAAIATSYIGTEAAMHAGYTTNIPMAATSPMAFAPRSAPVDAAALAV